MPSIGQAVTGFAPAVYPNTGGIVGGVPGGTIGGSNTIPGTSGSTSAPISGQRSELMTFLDALKTQNCSWLEHNGLSPPMRTNREKRCQFGTVLNDLELLLLALTNAARVFLMSYRCEKTK